MVCGFSSVEGYPLLLEPNTLRAQGVNWCPITRRRFHLAMHAGDDIVLGAFQVIEPETIAVRRCNRYIQDYLSQQRECYEQYGE